jgi:hypothetical protein
MARILPDKSVTEFLTAYGVTELEGTCKTEQLIVKVWDQYGTKPDDEENAPGSGTFIAAIVICNECDTGVQLYRDRLEKA